MSWSVNCSDCNEPISAPWKLLLGTAVARQLRRHGYAVPMTTMDEARHYQTIAQVEKIMKTAKRD